MGDFGPEINEPYLFVPLAGVFVGLAPEEIARVASGRLTRPQQL